MGELIGGWSMGYNFALARSKEREVMKGQNYYFSSGSQVIQMIYFGSVISKLAEKLVQGRTRLFVKIAANVVPILALPAYILMASVRHENYRALCEFLNKKLPISLPLELGARSVKVIQFITEHTGTILSVAMTIAGIALVALGSTYYGGALLAGVAYDAIDKMGLVPRKISLFIETYMPTVTLVGMALYGSILVKITSLLFATKLLPTSINFWLQHRIDAYVKGKFAIGGPLLQEIDAPVVEKKIFSYDEIKTIVEMPKEEFHSHFETNPAACCKDVSIESNLIENRNFDRFLTLFDQVKWEEKYPMLVKKIAYDERFQKFFKDQFPQVTAEEIQSNADHYIQRLAAEKNISKERYAKELVRDQLVELVKVLQEKKRVDGEQQDLDDALSVLAKILTALETPSSCLDFEDSLLKISVEAGDYCARAIKRTASEIMASMTFKGLDPMQEYELKVRQGLQQMRYEGVMAMYEMLKQKLLSRLPPSVQYDVHTFDIYRLYLSLGLYPLTKHERHKFGMLEMLTWSQFYRPNLQKLYPAYQRILPQVIDGQGRAYFNTYIQGSINNNQILSVAQKDELCEMFQEGNNRTWSVEETYERFGRLMFLRLGILRKQKVA